MHGDGQVSRLVGQCRVNCFRILSGQPVRIHAARFCLLTLLGIAQKRPSRIVQLQIAATGIVERADRLLPRRCDVGEIGLRIGIDVFYLRVTLTEVKHARRRDRYLRRNLADALQKLEMLDLRMTDKADLSRHPDRVASFLHAFEVTALIGLEGFDASQALEEVEMPKRTTELAVSGHLQAYLLLLLDDLLDLAVFNFLQRRGADLTLFKFRARILQRGGPQQTADMIGAKRRYCAGRHH
jgi:hypothetical protein